VDCVDINNYRYNLDDFLNTLPESKHKSTNGGKVNPEGWLLKALRGVRERNPGRDATGAKITD